MKSILSFNYYSISLLLYYYLFIISTTTSWSELQQPHERHKKRVAVCITGQVDRWIPESFVENVIHANPDVHFSIFIHLQFANKHHNTSFNLEYGVPSHYATSLSLQQSLTELSELFTTNHSDLIDFQFQQPYSHEEWQRLMHREGQPLDRITQYVERQHIILNMYKNHLACLDSIKLYTQERHQHHISQQHHHAFDYIINAREDLYFFHGMPLKYAFHQLDTKPQCGLVTKGCVVNHCMNMRMQIARYPEGLKIFNSRISFYQSMFQTGKQIGNPECFELYQLEKDLHYENCILPVDYFPLTSGRIVPPDDKQKTKTKYCLLEKEVQSLSWSDHSSSKYACVPSKVYEQVDKELKCFPFVMKPAPPVPNPRDYLSFATSLRKSISFISERGTE